MLTPLAIPPILRFFRRIVIAQPVLDSTPAPILSGIDFSDTTTVANSTIVVTDCPSPNSPPKVYANIWEPPYIPVSARATGSTSTFDSIDVASNETESNQPSDNTCTKHSFGHSHHRVCTEHPAGCPHHPLESPLQRDIMCNLIKEQGRNRFPPRSHQYFHHAHTYLPSLRPVSPGTYHDSDLVHIRASPSFHVTLELNQMEEENYFQGIGYRLYSLTQEYKDPIRRGTTIVINNHQSKHAIYIATLRRHITRDFSLVQLNALACDNTFLANHNLDWPTLLMSVPNQYCKVPMPRFLVPYYSEFIAPHRSTMSTIWSIFCYSTQTVEEDKWEIDILG